MDVHIVCTERDHERILYRLAAVLARETGWTLSEMPRPDAALNYFLPYLGYQVVGTRTAAWFTHHDARQQHKRRQWEVAAAAVDLRTTSTTPYHALLAPLGATVKVPVPLDRAIFTPADALPEGFTVGVSGFVYHDGRKGEDLIRQLALDFADLDWRAVGQGWNIPTTFVATGALPAFYQSLRLYVCASRVEGVPYPPLEALACGVPVVIPRGVGLLDDLPDIEGIYRFDAGNYDSLKAALAHALTALGAVEREALRAATEAYTPEAWAVAHEQAFEVLINPVTVPVVPNWHDCAGAYVVGFGDPARDCAANALDHWRVHMPDVPFAFVGAEPLGGEDVFIERPDADVGARIAKIDIYDNAPADWQYVLYMDADTEVIAGVSFLFDCLQDGWELVICKNPARFHIIREMKRPDNHEECAATFEQLGSDELLQLNGGVFAFRRCARVERFFRRWRQEWEHYGKRDQAALLRALYAEPLKVYVLGNEWNTVTRYMDASQSAGILHYPTTARRWSKRIDGRLDSPEAWRAVDERKLKGTW